MTSMSSSRGSRPRCRRRVGPGRRPRVRYRIRPDAMSFHTPLSPCSAETRRTRCGPTRTDARCRRRSGITMTVGRCGRFRRQQAPHRCVAIPRLIAEHQHESRGMRVAPRHRDTQRRRTPGAEVLDGHHIDTVERHRVAHRLGGTAEGDDELIEPDSCGQRRGLPRARVVSRYGRSCFGTPSLREPPAASTTPVTAPRGHAPSSQRRTRPASRAAEPVIDVVQPAGARCRARSSPSCRRPGRPPPARAARHRHGDGQTAAADGGDQFGDDRHRDLRRGLGTDRQARPACGCGLARRRRVRARSGSRRREPGWPPARYTRHRRPGPRG